MSEPIDLAVVGVTGSGGELALSLLAEREFPVRQVYALDEATSAGGRVEFRDAYLKVLDVAAFDFSRVRIALFFADPKTTAEHVLRAAAAGCVVIDDSDLHRYEDDVPLVVPEVNADAIAGYGKRNLIASPNAATTALTLVMNPLHQAAGVVRVNVVTFQAVSGVGKAGIEELAMQTTSLLNLKSPESRIFPVQVAFNVVPQIGEFMDTGYTREEMKMIWEARKILQDTALMLNPTTVRVPVFYGHALALHVETRDKISVEQVRDLLRKAPGVSLKDQRRPGGYPTPVSDAAGEDAVFVGRVREDISHPRGIDLWAVTDNVRKGAALNSVQIAEILVKDHLT